MAQKKGGRQAAAKKRSEAEKAAQARLAAEKRKKRIRNIIITVVCVVLALSMTIPSVATMLSRGDAEASDTGTDESTDLVAISEGYEATYKDLLKQADSEGQDNYDETLQENYITWANALVSAASSATMLYADNIDEAFQMLYDSIDEAMESSSEPGAYYYSYEYAYLGAVQSFGYCSSLGNEDVSAKKTAANNLGVREGKKAIEHEYTAEAADVLAQLQRSAGDTSDAISTEETCVGQFPDYTPAWYHLASYYASNSENESALAAYQQVLDTDPDDEYGYASDAQTQIESLNETIAQEAAEEEETEESSGEDSSE